ncbi:Sodium ion transport-associated [Balamuthia mandrillaris]
MVDIADKVFLGIYTVELVLKVLAHGFILHKGAYLRNAWNWLDFVILVVNWVMLLVELSESETERFASVVRVVRVFRTLRLLSAIPKLRRIVTTLILSIPYLLNVLGLLCLFFLLFGIPSVVLFGGQLRKHCVLTSTTNSSTSFVESFFDADLTCVEDDTVVGGLQCDEVEGLEEASCEETNSNPGFGTISFDNFLIATFNLFQCTMMEEWTNTMYLVMDATNYFAGLYFLVVVFVGAFFIVNLFLGIVESTYHNLGEDNDQQHPNKGDSHEQQTAQRQPAMLLGEVEEDPHGRERNGKRALKREVEMQTFEDGGVEEEDEDLWAECGEEKEEARDSKEVKKQAIQQNNDASEGQHTEIETSQQRSEGEEQGELSNNRRTETKNIGLQLGQACKKFWRNFCNWLKRPSDIEHRQWNENTISTVQRWYYAGATWVDHHVANSRWFEVVIMGLIVLNTVLLAMVFKNQPDGYTLFLFIANIVLNSLFTVEMITRLYSLGLWMYLTKDGFNLFDCLVVVIGWAEIIVVIAQGNESTPGVAMFRALRLLRTLRFVRFWDSLTKLVKTIGRVTSSLAYNLLLLTVVMFIFAVMGMYLFAGKFGEEEKPRLHFDTFFWSFMTVFQLVSGTDWIGTMRNAVRATTWAASMYFIALLTTSSFLVLNLFLSILLGSFDLTSNEARAERANQPSVPNSQQIAGGTKPRSPNEPATPEDEGVQEEESFQQTSEQNSEEESDEEWLEADESDEDISAKHQQNKVVLRFDMNEDDGKDKAADKSIAEQERVNRRELRIQKRLAHTSLFGISPGNPVRIFCLRLTTHPIFEMAIAIAIVVSCITLALEPHFEGNVSFAVFLSLDVTFAVIFLGEMLMKWVGQGLFAHPYAYFRSGWNIIDALVVLVSIISLLLLPTGADISFLRALRAFRPIRLLVRFAQTRVVLKAILRTLPILPSLLFISGFIWVIFAILGLQLFVGTFDYCNDSSVSTETQCTGNFTTEDGVIEEREWLTPKDNFDNFGEALFTVFKMASLENFQTVLFQAVDITNENEQPQRDASPQNVWYFLVFIPICCWLVLGLFTGGIIDQFSKTRLEESFKGTVFLTEQQREWIHILFFPFTFFSFVLLT